MFFLYSLYIICTVTLRRGMRNRLSILLFETTEKPTTRPSNLEYTDWFNSLNGKTWGMLTSNYSDHKEYLYKYFGTVQSAYMSNNFYAWYMERLGSNSQKDICHILITLMKSKLTSNRTSLDLFWFDFVDSRCCLDVLEYHKPNAVIFYSSYNG